MAIPTHYPMKYKCGHTVKTDLSKIPASKRAAAAQSDFYVSRARDGKGMDCPRCFQKNSAADKEQFLKQLMLDTIAFEDEHGLPELTGTEKMISSGLIDSARRDRFTALAMVADDENYADDWAGIITDTQSLTWAGWWVNNFSYKVRKANDTTSEDVVELIRDGAEQEATRPQTDAYATENPHDWNPDQEHPDD